MNKALIVILLVAFCAFSHAEEEVTLTSGEWPPYTSEHLKHYGVFSRIVTEAFALAGYRVRYEFFPWKRSYASAKNGAFDGSVTWAPTAERKRDFYFTDPVTFNRKVFFHLKSFPFDYRSVDDLRQYRVGATAQYTYGATFDQAVRSGAIPAELVMDDAQNIHKLLHDRIDVFPMDIEVGYSLVYSELSADQAALVTHHPLSVMEAPIAVAISRQIPEQRAKKLIEGFNRGLKQLVESGSYDHYFWQSRRGKYRQ